MSFVVKYIILGFFGILAVYFLLSYLLPKIELNRDFTETPTGIPIYICSNGVHTDVALPVKTRYMDWRDVFPPSSFRAVDTNFQYIEVGWGDKGFYLNTPTWADLKCSTAFKALFFLDSAAMHVTYDRYPPAIVPKLSYKIMISPKQYQQMVAYIQQSFNLHAGRVAVFPGKGYDVTDNFYEAKGHYSFTKTCNVWTCGALKAADLPCPLWSPFERGIIDLY